jgi:hypothetical protein
VEDPSLLNRDDILFPASFGIKATLLSLGCNILFTSRRDFILSGVIPDPVKGLSPEDSFCLLAQRRKPDDISETECAKAICKSVEYLPLAIVLIAALLDKRRDLSFADFHEELTKNKLYAVDYGNFSKSLLPTGHEAAIAVTLEYDWKVLDAEAHSDNQIVLTNGNNAKKLFQLLGFFPESALVPKDRLALFSDVNQVGSSKLDRPIESAIVLLDELNLVDQMENGRSVRMHPLLRSFAQTKIIESESEFKCKAVYNLIKAYQNLSLLYDEYFKRDIDQVIEDLDIAAKWCGDNSDTLQDLLMLRRILILESHHLQGQ